MTKYNHDINQYLEWLNEGKSYDDMADLMGVSGKAIIHKWILTNYILEKKVVFTAKKRNKKND